ncbi:PIN domain-containing protein [Aquincola sp. MAHUQ-54]|uniref:PIN domain-containing protein n=1 Tax=Aquincola agrisoli TaxID=3119538 RepID=A0AAW9Q1Q0_9BURK
MIAVDSSVLIDVLIGDPHYADASEGCITEALAADDVVVCDAVVTEVQAMLDASVSLMDTLATLGIRHLPGTEQAAMRAGHMYRRFRARGGRRERAATDFLIGAHALLQCNGLITRDDAFYREYFKGLKLIVPKA